MDKVRMMNGYLLKLLTLFLIIFYLGSCSDPIFYTVTQETPLVKPLIDGSPSNFAKFNNEIYVATGKKIFKYGKSADSSKCEWSRVKNLDDEKLGGYVVRLAATDNSLYALYLSDSSSNSFGEIKYTFYLDGVDEKGKPIIKNGKGISSYNQQFIQSIFTPENTNVMFICARKSDNTYTIYYLDEDDPSFEINDPFASVKEIIDFNLYFVLNGVAFDGKYYYLCSKSGIFYMEKDKIDSPSELKDEDDKTITEFTGIINLDPNHIAAITYNGGDLYEINDAKIAYKASFNDSRYSTGSIAIWNDKDDPTKRLLLVGREEYYYSTTSGYSNGYVEIEIDTNTGGIKEGAEFSVPGKNPLSSIDNYDRYVSSLGKKIIKHFIQVPADIDPNMTLFASTQKDGVWSYRDHNDGEGITWNAEK